VHRRRVVVRGRAEVEDAGCAVIAHAAQRDDLAHGVRLRFEHGPGAGGVHAPVVVRVRVRGGEGEEEEREGHCCTVKRIVEFSSLFSILPALVAPRGLSGAALS
jgi:hypothetical protein